MSDWSFHKIIERKAENLASVHDHVNFFPTGIYTKLKL